MINLNNRISRLGLENFALKIENQRLGKEVSNFKKMQSTIDNLSQIKSKVFSAIDNLKGLQENLQGCEEIFRREDMANVKPKERKLNYIPKEKYFGFNSVNCDNNSYSTSSSINNNNNNMNYSINYNPEFNNFNNDYNSINGVNNVSNYMNYDNGFGFNNTLGGEGYGFGCNK